MATTARRSVTLADKPPMEAAAGAMRLLKTEREKRSISLGELAERTGIDKSRLSKLENDHDANPTLETLARIAAGIGVDLMIGVRPSSAAA